MSVVGAFAVAMLVPALAGAQENKQTCAWNDAACLRTQQQVLKEECRWNEAECLRREQERARAEARVSERRRAEYEVEFVDFDFVRCEARDRRGDCESWERHDRNGRRVVRHGRMPHMSAVLAIRNGRGIPRDARVWLGPGPFRVDMSNRDRDRLPERATIHSVHRRETQVWYDRNNDGWVDRILIYRNGRLVRELR
jgi:hypothetical protein